MREEDQAPAPRRAPGALRWLGLAAIAAVLLGLSQLLWVWQTWPVREMLERSAPAAPTPLPARPVTR